MKTAGTIRTVLTALWANRSRSVIAGSLLLLAAVVLLAPPRPSRADPGSGEPEVAGRTDGPEAGVCRAAELIGLLQARLEDRASA